MSLSTLGSNEVIHKTKVVFRVNHFTDNTDRMIYSDDIIIGSDVWGVVVKVESIGWDGRRDQPVWPLKVGVFVRRAGDVRQWIDAERRVRVMDRNGQPFGDEPVVDEIRGRQRFEVTQIYRWKAFVPHGRRLIDRDKRYLTNSSVTVAVDIAVYKRTDVGVGVNRIENRLAHNLVYDCRLCVGSEGKRQILMASKAVLIDRSEVFQKMFDTNMWESQNDFVIIKDIDPHVFQQFLHYLHFGDSDQLYSMAEQLLYVSEKYMVWDLKTICENLYYLRINPKNALEVWEVMDKYGIQELIAKSIGYINRYWNQIVRFDWRKRVGNDRKLIEQLMDALKTESYYDESQTMSYTYTPRV